MEVSPDGSFEQELESGHRIAGKIANPLENVFTPGSASAGISATHTSPRGREVLYDDEHRNSYSSDQSNDNLNKLMFFYSQHYSEDNYRENFERAETLDNVLGVRLDGKVSNLDSDIRKHMERGLSIMERDAADLSVDLRINVDKLMGFEEEGGLRTRADRYSHRVGYERWQAHLQWRQDQGLPLDHDAGPLEERSRNVKNIVCEGLSCKGMLGKGEFFDAFEPGDFVPARRWGDDDDNLTKVRTILANQGVYLTLDGTSGSATHGALDLGAWMDDAGFFVSVGGHLNRAPDSHYGVSFRYGESFFDSFSDARMVAAVGERTGSLPAADATWRGSMVGTAPRGPSKDNLLRGEAELKFGIGDSRLDARFFNIRDYNRFGEEYVTVHGKKPGQIVFPDIPVAADGSYERKYRRKRGDTLSGSISGAFYGTGHHETAGTFRGRGILGAFGAKKVVPKAAVPEAAAN